MKKTKPIAIIIVLVCTIIGAVGQLWVKLGSERITNDLLSILNIYIIMGIGLIFFGTFFFIYALKNGEVTILYPLIALNYVWVNTLSIIYLGEQNTIQKWIGNFIIVLGVSMIAFSGKIRKMKNRKRGRR